MPTNSKSDNCNPPQESSQPSSYCEPSCYAHIGFAALCVTAAELLLKRGAMATANDPGLLGFLGVSVLVSGWTWLAMVPYTASFVIYLQVLRRMPLHLAFALMSIVQVLVPLGAWLFLGEHIGSRRWCGIFVVLTGVLVIAGPAMKSEEQL